MRLTAHVVGSNTRDDRRQTRRTIVFEGSRTLFRRAENRKMVADLLLWLLKKFFHPTPALAARALAVAVDIKGCVECAHGTFPMLLCVLIDLAPGRGKLFRRVRQRHPAVAQSTHALETIFVPVGDNPDRDAGLLH